MKKKFIFGLIFLLLAFGFLEAQYHFFLRTNRYWSNAGRFSTDHRIQSIGANNTLRAAYSNSLYFDIVCASDGTADLNNAGQINFTERAVANRGEGTYLFANGLAIGNSGEPGDSQGIKMEFDWGSTDTDLTGNGRMAHGLDIKMTMEQSWDFTSNDRNAVIRGARIQGWSQDDVGGKVVGAYINARAEGTAEIQGIIGGTDDGPGVIAIDARTELGTGAVITTPAVVGVKIFHNSKTGSNLIGHYKAINIFQPLLPTQTGTKYGIWFGDDNNTGYPYDYALGFSSELDLDTVAHYDEDYTASGVDTLTDVDGWIIVEIDGNPLYIYCFKTIPSK